jgi:phosphate uptake regulator
MANLTRKLQKIGSSLLISIPSNWAKNINLQKGDSISIEINSDSSISIFPITQEEILKEVTIEFPDSNDKWITQIYGAYLLGYDIIRIKGSLQINFTNREMIKSVLRKLVGLEIVDEEGVVITTQFLLDASSMDISKILRRMSSIIGGMHRDVMNSMNHNYVSQEPLLRGRDDEVDRQYFLIVRLIRTAMMDRRLASNFNLSNIDMLDYRIAANLVESAGDYIANLASFMPDFSDNTLSKIKVINLLIAEMQEKSINGFITRNIDNSSQVVTLYSKVKKMLDSMMENYFDYEVTSLIKLIKVVYLMDEIARCWVDVADLIKPIYENQLL